MYSRASVRAMGMLSGLLSLVWLGMGAGCGSSTGEPSAAEPSPPPSPSSAGSGSAPPAQQSGSPTPSAPTPAPGSTPSPSPSTPAAPDDDDPAAVDGAAAVDACSALGGSDACGACVCTTCKSDLDTCFGVEGCTEILACVRESGCSGRDCYCGDARLTECVRGEANGPCMDAVLAAPGGKAPSLNDASGGPASDAAQRVADCAQADDACKDVCGLGE